MLYNEFHIVWLARCVCTPPPFLCLPPFLMQIPVFSAEPYKRARSSKIELIWFGCTSHNFSKLIIPPSFLQVRAYLMCCTSPNFPSVNNFLRVFSKLENTSELSPKLDLAILSNIGIDF